MYPKCVAGQLQLIVFFIVVLRKLRLVAFGALSGAVNNLFETPAASSLLAGLVMLDKAGIVHNDIKPDNLIWTEAWGRSGAYW